MGWAALALDSSAAKPAELPTIPRFRPGKDVEDKQRLYASELYCEGGTDMRRLPLIWTAVAAVVILGGSIALMENRRSASADASDVASDTATERSVPPNHARENRFEEFTLARGTRFSVSLDEGVGSASSRIDAPVHAHVTTPVIIDEVVVVPEGSTLSGTVVEAERSGRVKGRARVAVQFDSLRLPDDGETHSIRTGEIERVAPGTKKKDAMKIGIPAAAGAILGGVLGGGKGAVIGGAVGGGGGAAYVMSERGKETGIARGAHLSVTLLDEVKIKRPAARGRLLP